MTCLSISYSIKVSHHKTPKIRTTLWRTDISSTVLPCEHRSSCCLWRPCVCRAKTSADPLRSSTRGMLKTSRVSKFDSFGNSFNRAYLGMQVGHDQLLILRLTYAISLRDALVISCTVSSMPSRDHICFHLHHLGLHYLRCTSCKGEGLTCTHT